ncbi:MAG: hypothetical protein BWY82_02743 [Verrucomicrobia bacterium ADurb.Bin474]|nr:MAG: hypothetical protein BWY82_02743 [Verrucomicrobia bacterium ADurb.Bin474]
MLAHKSILGNHFQTGDIPNNLPWRCRHHRKLRGINHARKIRIRQDLIPIGIVVRCDRKTELPVFKHLSPDASVNATPHVFDKLAIDKWMDRTRIRRVQTDMQIGRWRPCKRGPNGTDTKG